MEEKFAFRKSQKVYLQFKRRIDFVFSLLSLIILCPLLLILALITKCSSKGPAIFKQKRIGKDERIFTMYKFRSMRADAPQIPPSELSDDEQFALTTKWGRFMRKTSLDELPQLLNVLKGDMSLIGPRPQAEKENEQNATRRGKASIRTRSW